MVDSTDQSDMLTGAEQEGDALIPLSRSKNEETSQLSRLDSFATRPQASTYVLTGITVLWSSRLVLGLTRLPDLQLRCIGCSSSPRDYPECATGAKPRSDAIFDQYNI